MQKGRVPGSARENPPVSLEPRYGQFLVQHEQVGNGASQCSKVETRSGKLQQSRLID